MTLDQIISNICLAGVQPQSGSFMTDHFFPLCLFSGSEFHRFVLSALKSFGKKANHFSTYSLCTPLPLFPAC